MTYIILISSILVWAQNPASGLPYECGFEEGDTTLSAWVLNPGTAAAKDQWMIGTAAHSGGHRSLYISSDGTNVTYGSKPNIVAAYLRFKFPTDTVQQNYDISFDWKGEGDTLKSHLRVLVCPEEQLTNADPNNPYYLAGIVSTSTGNLSNASTNACEQLGESYERFVCGSEKWQTVTLSKEFRLNPNYSSKTFAIVFLWVNANSDTTIHRSSIAIDNVQINSAMLKKPEKVQVIPQCDDSTMLVTWESGLSEFEVQYRKIGDANWRRASGLADGVDGFNRVDGSQCSYVIKRILEGTYDVRVRGVAGEGLTTSWEYRNMVLVYCPDNHCVNYIDLYSPNVVCTWGKHEAHQGETPYDNIGVIDYGPDSENSRHTIHVDPNELDARADSLLPTVPPGALASVRLGNWNPDGNAHSITYNIPIDSTQSILILRYAVVLDNSGHDRYEEPYFRVEILDQNGKEIDVDCGRADFTYSDAVLKGNTDGWHLTTYDGVYGTNELAWKEWTTVGMDLMPYQGQTIQVRITTADCGQSIHFGYGYFTLDCASAKIQTESCGSDAKVSCLAPDGFNYEWRDETGTIVGNEQELSVDAGPHTYTCTVSFVENPDCNFEISTFSWPRFAVPDYTFERVYGGCESKLKFKNTSHVMNKYEDQEIHTNEPCTDFNWRFRRLSNDAVIETAAQSPIYTCPEEGDSIEVTYTCYIGTETLCDSTRVDTIVVPNIHSRDSVWHVATCPEEPVYFAGKWFNTDTTVVSVFDNFAGCDSTVTMKLKVQPVFDQYIHDSICSDQYVTVNGVKYNQPLDKYLIMLKTVNGCDSAIYLTLTVNERLAGKVVPPEYVCADSSSLFLEIDIEKGVFDSLQIAFSTPELRDTVIYDSSIESVKIPYPDTITPGRYEATLRFYQFCCGVHEETHPFDIRYRASIVEQKWNDVLTLLSPAYNGGYRFTAFQWYKDDLPIENETHSYLYQPLDTLSEYYVMLTREDGVMMATCPITPVIHVDQTKFPTIATKGQQLPVYMNTETRITYYTVSGMLYSTFILPQGYGTLPTPDNNGVYVIKSTDSQGVSKAQIMIVE